MAYRVPEPSEEQMLLLQRLADGETASAIGEDLGIGEDGVRAEMNRIEAKLHEARAYFQLGDRAEYLGPDHGPNSGSPRPGERGEIFHLSPFDDCVTWDDAGSECGLYAMRLVEDETGPPGNV
jgi:hypothetical protein